MAGTITYRSFFHLANLGNLAPLNKEFTISVDEYNHVVSELAKETSEAIALGPVSTVQGLLIQLTSGGTTMADGLAIDLEASTYATPHLVLFQGQQVFINTNISILSVRNLHASNAVTYEYVLLGT